MKQPIFLDSIHEFDLEVEDETYTLYYSEGEQWNSSSKGKVACQLIDDGNGFQVSKMSDKNRFDYSEAGYLYILLRVIEKDSNYQIGELKSL